MPGRDGPKDRFAQYNPMLGDPCDRWVAITPSDAADLPFEPRAIYVGSSGNLRVIDGWDNDTVIRNVPSGSVLPGRFKKILSSGTTASDIVIID